jgi:hypothetical protein
VRGSACRRRLSVLAPWCSRCGAAAAGLGGQTGGCAMAMAMAEMEKGCGKMWQEACRVPSRSEIGLRYMHFAFCSQTA